MDYIGLIILSLFCAGGVFAYVREASRLHQLIGSGIEVEASIQKKQKIDSSSDSVTHFLLTYSFVERKGRQFVHEQDLNSRRFFESLSVGDRIEILYLEDIDGNSYPLSQVRADKKIASSIAVGILLVWVVMGVILSL